MSFTVPSSSSTKVPSLSPSGSKDESRKRKRAQSEAPADSPGIDEQEPKRSRHRSVRSKRATTIIGDTPDEISPSKKLTLHKSNKRSDFQPSLMNPLRRVKKTLSEGDVFGDPSSTSEARGVTPLNTDAPGSGFKIPNWLLEIRDQARRDQSLVAKMNSALYLSTNTQVRIPNTIREHPYEERAAQPGAQKDF
ncbi:hypothetical protein JR316_0000109 [Psilocybe cubensis]|uniref:Uncharacterized protein n=2 Tax=Psilocybe cubensis TaxID=181762 RepID=A0A8H7Y9A2_PSICU|nr:hypothetical protein JR316_0000109 [Psilocybe cubensis]KAH9486045.1 hypothetical protein JR316_0000109 [Psilocybe cubensis]